MSRIILVTGYFNKYDRAGYSTGEKELLVSHGINEDTDEMVVMPNVPPSHVQGAVYDTELMEWVI